MRTFTRLAAMTSLASLEALAANNWQQPCFSGHCTYELPATHNTSSAAVHIWGSQNAISDVTTAGGWHILNCDPQTPAQDIRLVCTSHNASAAGCDHVMQGGAEHTIVRLPENCTAAPFARVANVSVAEDQSVPAHTKRALFGRADAAHPPVHTFTLDTNFSAIDTTRNGNVSFAVQGLNVPGYSGNFTITPPAQTRRAASRAFGRGKARRVVFGRLPLLSRRDDADADPSSDPGPSDTTTEPIDTATDTDPQPTDTTSGADGTTSADATATSDAGDATTGSDASDPQQTGDPNDPNDPDTSTAPKSSKLPPFQFNLHENLFNKSVACTTGGKNASAQSSAKVSVDLDAQATMQVVIGVDASGTLSPPKISDISLTASVLGSLDGKLSFTADATGKFNIPSKVIAQKAISGLSIPGILNVTPTFLISAQAQGSLGLGFVSSVDLNYNISSAELTFPPQKKTAPPPKQVKPSRRAVAKGKGTSGSGAGGDSNSASVQRGDSAISLSTSPGSNGKADISAHVIPEVGVELSGLGESANVVLKMDTSAELTLGPNSGGTSNPPPETDGSSSETSSAASETSSADPETSSAGSETSSAASETSSAGSETAKSIPTARSQKPARRASGSAQTCAKITTGMNMHASSDGNFFGLFDKTTSAQLFNKNFTLLNKCFPAGKAPGNPGSTSTGTGSTPINTATDDPDDPNATPTDTTDAPGATSTDTADDGTSTIDNGSTDTDSIPTDPATPTDDPDGVSTDTSTDDANGTPTADPDSTDSSLTATASSDPSAPTDDPDAGVTQTDSNSTPTDTASAQSSDSPVLPRTVRFSRGGSRRDVWRAFMRQAQSNTGLQCSTSGTTAPQPLVSQTVPADGQQTAA